MLKLHIQYDDYTVILYCFYAYAVYSFIRLYSGIVSTMYRQYVLQRDSEEARVDAAYPFYRPMPNFQVMSIVHRALASDALHDPRIIEYAPVTLLKCITRIMAPSPLPLTIAPPNSVAAHAPRPAQYIRSLLMEPRWVTCSLMKQGVAKWFLI